MFMRAFPAGKRMKWRLYALLWASNAVAVWVRLQRWTAREPHESLPPESAMNTSRHLVRSGLLLLACALAQEVSAAPAQPAGPPACSELERRLELGGPMQLSLLLFAAADSGCLPLARRLIEAGASLEARDRLGAMALARAARAGHVALVELFLARGAAIDARNLFGATALYGATENERQATVAALLAKNADPNLPGRSGVTPLAAAAYKGSGRIVDLLIARGATVDALDSTGKSAITYAAARGFALIVRRLLDAGVDPKRAYGNGLTALMWAAGHEDGVGDGAAGEVIELLLAAGAPIDAVDNRGRTALMIAAELSYGAIVEMLLARGADRAIADASGKRAVDLAASESVRAKLQAR
jgi:ankyrin repeat protein